MIDTIFYKIEDFLDLEWLPNRLKRYRLTNWFRDRSHDVSFWLKFSDWSPKGIYYILKNRFVNRSNVVYVKYYSNWSYVDRANLLRHAVFQVLVDFVEREKPFEHFDTKDSHNKENWDEIRRLYNYYKQYIPFDSYKRIKEKLGRDPYTYASVFGDKIASEELNEWGQPAYYTLPHYERTEEEKSAFDQVDQEEAAHEKEFTENAKKVVDLWRMLWT